MDERGSEFENKSESAGENSKGLLKKKPANKIRIRRTRSGGTLAYQIGRGGI